MASTKRHRSQFRSQQMAQVMDEAVFRMRQAKPPSRGEIPKAYGGTARQFNHPLEKGLRRSQVEAQANLRRSQEQANYQAQVKGAQSAFQSQANAQAKATGGALAPQSRVTQAASANRGYQMQAAKQSYQGQRASINAPRQPQGMPRSAMIQNLAKLRGRRTPKRIPTFGTIRKRNRRAPVRRFQV